MVRFRIWPVLILVVGIAAGYACAAGEQPTDANAPQTLREYLTYAALHNAGLKAAFEGWKVALEAVPVR